MTFHISADDFGLNNTVNSSIEQLLIQKHLDSVSLLVNFPQTTAAAIHIYQAHPTAKLNLHCNLTEGKPISKNTPSLIQRNGHFYPPLIFLFRAWLHQINLHEVTLEINAQIEAAKHHGLTITALNSHQNMHLFPPLDLVFKNLAKKHHVKYIRSHASVLYRLHYLPFRLVLYHLLMTLMQLRFGRHQKFNSPLELPIHPGSSYDPPQIKSKLNELSQNA